MKSHLVVVAAFIIIQGSGIGCQKLDDIWNSQSSHTDGAVIGYVEGDYRYLAAPITGWLKSVPVNIGDDITQGELAFDFRDDAEKFAVNQAHAQLQAQVAQSRNLTTGARPQETASLRSQLHAAQAELQLAKLNLARYETLKNSEAISQLQYDQAVTEVKTAQATVDSIQAQIQAADLPARPQTQNAANATSKAAQAALEKAQWQLGQLTVTSPIAGEITQVYYHSGEFVTTGQPIIQILPNDNQKIIFYIAENKLAQLKIGQKITVHALQADPSHAMSDSQASNSPISNPPSSKQTATVSYISNQASYTPPVIYSNENANKLTYRVEATLDTVSHSSSTLHIGQPVQVDF